MKTLKTILFLLALACAAQIATAGEPNPVAATPEALLVGPAL